MSSLQDTVIINLLEVHEIQIHGSPYYHLVFHTDASDAQQQMRINPEAFYPNPQPGDRVAVNMLMGNIMGAKKIS